MGQCSQRKVSLNHEILRQADDNNPKESVKLKCKRGGALFAGQNSQKWRRMRFRTPFRELESFIVSQNSSVYRNKHV